MIGFKTNFSSISLPVSNMKYKLYKNKKEINFNEFQKSRRFKRDNEMALKTRPFFTRWRFQTRIKRVYKRRFFKPGRFIYNAFTCIIFLFNDFFSFFICVKSFI
jgi:hypothetical protein